jgi:hypothetical protein
VARRESQLTPTVQSAFRGRSASIGPDNAQVILIFKRPLGREIAGKWPLGVIDPRARGFFALPSDKVSRRARSITMRTARQREEGGIGFKMPGTPPETRREAASEVPYVPERKNASESVTACQSNGNQPLSGQGQCGQFCRYLGWKTVANRRAVIHPKARWKPYKN